MDKSVVKITPEGDKVSVFSGNAPEQKPEFRKGINVSGTIGIVKEHLSKNYEWLTTPFNENSKDAPINFSYIKADKAEGKIVLIEDEGFPWSNTYTGKIELDPRYVKFGINSDKAMHPHKLSDFIKMNRSFFQTKSEAMKLVSDLRGFEAKIDSEIKDKDDSRGNRTLLRAQTVESNLPKAFNLVIPIIKGQAPQTIEVEVAIDSQDLSCSLVSPDAADFIETTRQEEVEKQLKEISELHENLRIFEV